MKKSFLNLIRFLGLLKVLRRIQLDIFSLKKNFLTEDEISKIYGALYHTGAGYGSSADNELWESDEVIKNAHAHALLRALPFRPKKILIGGCSSGMAVLAFRRIGVEAFGFEISPNLDEICIPEVRDFIRYGSMTSIPYGSSDNFDLFITTDVLEHIQLKHINLMVQEVYKLNVPVMAHLINYDSMSIDHMTLKPLVWWARKFKSRYRLDLDIKTEVHSNKRIYGLNGDPRHEYSFFMTHNFLPSLNGSK